MNTSTTSTNSPQKYLINCQDGANHVERASIAFVLAVTASKTHEAAVFITAEAAHLCVKGGTEGLVADCMEPLSDLVAQFQNSGGKIWLCPICAKTKGIEADDLMVGVEIAGAPKTMAYLASGGMLLA